ncbi:hypothetical protein V8E53_012517 [Lactarius tabidus]
MGRIDKLEGLLLQIFSTSRKLGGKGARCCTVADAHVFQPRTHPDPGICITTGLWGRITTTHLFSTTSLWSLPKDSLRSDAPCEYDNGYLVFDNTDRNIEVWRLSSDFAAEDEVAADSPPDDKQMAVSAHTAEVYKFHAPRGHFRPWALLRLPEFADVYRLVYPTLTCANSEHAFLYDVRTGSLVQTININLRTICDIDMSERHVFLCEQDAIHVISLESGREVLRIRLQQRNDLVRILVDAIVRCSRRVEDPSLVSGDWFVTPLSVSSQGDESPRSKYIAACVSRDGRDLVVLSEKHRVFFIQDFERICRGETTFERAGVILGIPPEDTCRYLGLEHGRVCVATVHGLYIFTFGPGLSAKAVFVRPSEKTPEYLMTCMQLTDSRIYFTWGNARRRRDIPMFKDEENSRELPRSSKAQPVDLAGMMWGGHHGAFEVSVSLGCIDFSLMPEGYASEI